MKSSLWIAAVVGCGFVSNGNGQLIEQERTCDLKECAVVSQNASFGDLSCEATNDKITEIISAIVVPEGGDCVLDVQDEQQCQDAIRRAEEECIGQISCSVDFAEVLESCGEFVAVRVRCGVLLDLFTIAGYLAQAAIGVGMGATLEVSEVKRIFTTEKKAVLIGFFSQFMFMPLIAFTLSRIFQFNDLISIGMVLAGSCPGGTLSNLLAYFGKASVGLSMTLTACSTLGALAFMPLLIYLYGNLGLGVSGAATVPAQNLLIALLLAVIPSIWGVWVRSKSKKAAKIVERIGGFFGFVLLIGILYSAGSTNSELLKPARFQKTWVSSALFFPIGATLGYTVSRFAGLDRYASRAVSLETGFQSVGVAIAAIGASFTGCDRASALTFPLVATFVTWLWAIVCTIFFRFVHSRWDPIVDENKMLGDPEQGSESGLSSLDKQDEDLSESRQTSNEEIVEKNNDPASDEDIVLDEKDDIVLKD